MSAGVDNAYAVASPVGMSTGLVVDRILVVGWKAGRSTPEAVLFNVWIECQPAPGPLDLAVSLTEPRVALQRVVQERAAQLGDVGLAWQLGLPELIADLEHRWTISVGEPLTGGTAAHVARARTADGRDAVLKLAVPDPHFARQIRTLAAADTTSFPAPP